MIIMKRNSIILLIVVIPLFFGCAAEQGSEQSGANEIFPYPVHQQKLENQLSVITVEYPSPDLAAFYIIVRAGSREEVEEGKTGFAHFFEHMMFRGTDQYPPGKYRQTLMSIGAAANANTWMDRTVYHMTGNAEMLEKMFEVEADRFLHLNYSEHDFKTEAGAVKGEYTKNYANPYRKISEKTLDAAFEEHTYKHTTMGFWDDIVDMPNQFDYSQEFFDRFYRPEYTTILVVGDVNPGQVANLAQEYFGTWETGSYQPDIPEEPEQTETKYTHLQVADFPPYLGMSYKSPAFNTSLQDVAALNIIGLMVFSERSALYQQLVVDEGLLRSLSFDMPFTRDPYLFTIKASFKEAEDMQPVKNRIEEQLESLKSHPVDTGLLADAKSHLKYSLAMQMDSPTAVAEILSYFIWVSGDPRSLNQLVEAYEKTTREDIMHVASAYFDSSKLTIATISPQTEGGIQ